MNQLPVLTLMGPTASGKTALAMALYDRLPARLVSVDSALVYREMNIGTAKPTAQEQSRYPHALIDIRDPLQNYSAASFYKDVIREIDEAHHQGQLPILVGGTMLYFKALLEGISELPSANEELREQISEEARQHGWPALHEQLAQFDPISAERIHPNDPQRLTRAIEVYRLSGQSLTQLTAIKRDPLPYRFYQFAMAPAERQTLHHRIEQRFDSMIEKGFEMEVNQLIRRGDLSLSLPSMRCVGYRQMWQYLSGEYDFEQMRFKALAATRQLAKRQLTWLRSWSDVCWLDSESTDVFNDLLNKFPRNLKFCL
ncbi:MAG: tRNA dimethylallyltransferase [Candidatus Celerinatantimonas neptuna]|nr:MAG: tRNA dimethylallyltransferase [Candidatus Celerinatantimonas neptuna]